MRRVILLMLVVLLAACVNQLAARQAYFSQFVGHSEADLVQQIGVPSRTYETGGVKYLAYTERRVDILQGFPAYGYGGPYWGWYGGGFPPAVVNMTCEVTFTVFDGIVRSFVLRGNACG